MTVMELETRLNRRLKEIHRGYAVKNLKRLPSGAERSEWATAEVRRTALEQLSAAIARPTASASWLLNSKWIPPPTRERPASFAAAEKLG